MATCSTAERMKILLVRDCCRGCGAAGRVWSGCLSCAIKVDVSSIMPVGFEKERAILIRQKGLAVVWLPHGRFWFIFQSTDCC